MRMRAVLVLIVAWGVMLGAEGMRAPFHPDEALYTTYARNAAVFGQWLLPGPVDKPPLSLYANALSLHLFAARTTPQNIIDVPIRAGEFAARLPNLFAGMLAVALVYALVKRINQRARIALLAALMMAVSPFTRAYGASAFTDMLMVTLALGTWLAVIAPKDWRGGFLLALAFSAKPQAIFFVPLIVVWRITQAGASHRLKWMLYGFACGLLPVLLWDIARPEASIFALGAAHLDRDSTFAPIHLWGARLGELLHHGRDLLGVPAWTVFLVGVGVVCYGIDMISHLSGKGKSLLGSFSVEKGQGWIILWILGFLAAHVVVNFPTFDRYLLPLLPVICWLVAEAFVTILPPSRMMTALVALAIILFGLLGTHDPRADVFRPTERDAYAQVSAWINAKPLGAIVYDRWLGWEMGYYLGAWTDKRPVYYPTGSAFAQDAPRNPDPAPRYLLVPEDYFSEAQAWLDAARRIGYRVRLDFAYGGLCVYVLEKR